MSIATLEADLGKVGHAFVVGAEKLKSVVIAVASDLQKEAPAIAEAETLANSVADAIYPGSATVLAAIEATLSKVFNAVDAAGAAAGADALNVSLDVATVAAIKAALPTVKAQATTTPGS